MFMVRGKIRSIVQVVWVSPYLGNKVHGSRLGGARFMLYKDQVPGLGTGSDPWFKGGC